jgi:hypothetical protein
VACVADNRRILWNRGIGERVWRGKGKINKLQGEVEKADREVDISVFHSSKY